MQDARSASESSRNYESAVELCQPSHSLEDSANGQSATATMSISGGLEYQTLPAHRRLWSWGWRSDAASTSEAAMASTEEGGSMAAWSGRFPLGGGGTVVLTLSATSSFNIAVCCQPETDGCEASTSEPWVGVRVGSQSAELVFFRGPGYGLRVLASTHFSGCGYGKGERSAFWLSFDPDNRTVKYGQGCRMRDRTFLSYTFAASGPQSFAAGERQSIDMLFAHTTKLIQLQNYAGLQVVEHDVYETPLMAQRAQEVASVQFDRTPLVVDPSPRLLDSRHMLLSDFDGSDFTFPANLSSTGQALAQQVLQPWLSLEAGESAEGPTLAQAIGYSLHTPGAALHKLLEEKIRDLPALTPSEQCHISVALGPAAGASPGPAYSLEILPPGHCMAPHDNANAHGVLRVLHGCLDVLLFDADLKAADEAAPLDEVELDPGDAMWFSPKWYQTHAMKNATSGYCCYLLARQYADDDYVRWPYVQTKAVDGSIRSSRVVADCSFSMLQTTVLRELQEALEANPNLFKKEKFSELERAYSDRTEAWVERTDSALDYTAYIESERSPDASKQHRFSCGPLGRLRRRNMSPESSSFMFSTPAIPEEPADSLELLWP